MATSMAVEGGDSEAGVQQNEALPHDVEQHVHGQGHARHAARQLRLQPRGFTHTPTIIYGLSANWRSHLSFFLAFSVVKFTIWLAETIQSHICYISRRKKERTSVTSSPER